MNFYTKIVFMFLIYSFLGWITEVLFAYYNRKIFVNRGFLYGPFCPIYGFGIIFVVLFLEKLNCNIFIMYVSAIFITSLLEYITGYILEKSFNSKWWDYSNNKFNLNGRICLSFSLVWGIAALFVFKIIHPIVMSFINIIPFKNYISILIIVYFIIDFITTILSIINLNNILEKLHQLSINTTMYEFMDIDKINNKFINKLSRNHYRLLKSFPFF